MPTIALAGIASAYIDGVAVKLVADATYQTSILSRESAMGMDGFHGFNAKYVPGKIAMKLRVTSDQTLSDYDDLESSTIVIELVNGTSVSGYTMFVATPPVGNAMEGTVDLDLEGPLVSVSK